MVIEPLSDRLGLQVVPHGFALTAAGTPIALAPQGDDTAAQARAVALTRRFRFAALPTLDLANRLRRQIAVAATAPPLSRGPLQRAVAETMIALGLGIDAQAILRVAALENPAEADVPDQEGLAAIAALLAGKPDQAASIEAPALSGSDEIALWRAVRQGELHADAGQAAATFAATWPLILTYPAAVRESAAAARRRDNGRRRRHGSSGGVAGGPSRRSGAWVGARHVRAGERTGRCRAGDL